MCDDEITNPWTFRPLYGGIESASSAPIAMSSPKHPPKDNTTAPNRATISFGFGGAVAKRPGLSKPATVTTSRSSEERADAPTATSNVDVTTAAISPLVIPLPKEASTAYLSRSETASAWEAYDPHKVGLQLRRSLREKGENGRPLPSEKARDNKDIDERHTERLPSFLKRYQLSSSEREKEDIVAEVRLEAYSKIPVDQFGAALLRGMGWREGEGVGRRRKQQGQEQSIKIAEPRMRPKGLGLGATMRSESKANKSNDDDEDYGRREMRFATDIDSSHPSTVSFAEAQLMLGVGSRVRVKRGAHVDAQGIVTKVLAGEAQVRLTCSGTLLVLDHDDLQVLKDERSQDAEVGDGPKDGRSQSIKASPSSSSSWLRPHIKVQFASDMSPRLAMHHGMQGDVLDVHQGLAIIRLSSGVLVTDVHADYLQPSPPSIGETVLMLAEGRFQGLKGILLGRDGHTAHVQLLDADDDNDYYGEDMGWELEDQASPSTAFSPHGIITTPLDSIAPCCI